MRLHKKRYLSNGAHIEVGWHYGLNTWHAELCAPCGDVRHFYDGTRKDLMARVRLALSRGVDNIYWDIPVLKRLRGNENGTQ